MRTTEEETAAIRHTLPASLNSGQPEAAAFWVKGIVEALEVEELDVVALLRDADLDPAKLTDRDARFPITKINHLWHLAVARSGDEGVGLRRFAVPRPGIFDIVGYAMMSAPNLRSVLDRAVRYVRIVSDAATLQFLDGEGGYRFCLEIASGESAIPWQRYAFDLLSLLSFLRWVMGQDLRPLALELTTKAETSLDLCRDAFDCPVRLAASSNCLVFSRADIELIPPTAHPQLAGVHNQVADEYLARLNGSQIGRRARSAILACLADGEPRRDIVARALGMSERTLQRRLQGEGHSFQRLLDTARRELAEKYLSRTDISLAETAYLLGFGDQSSFFRATKRWFGATPGGYRLRMARK